MAIADMFLKLEGATGESSDSKHKDEIEVVEWSWSMQGSRSLTMGKPGAATLAELSVTKRADKATTALMNFLRANKLVSKAALTVRKAGDGGVALEYLKIELERVRVTSISTGVDAGRTPPEALEVVTLGFEKIRVSYTPQGHGGGAGGGTSIFEGDAHAGT